MTATLSGTNGLLQSYDYQVLTTGFGYTFAAGVQVLVINPAGTLATGTITMPASPSDGMTITVESTQQVTAITVNANTGQSIVGAASQLIPNQSLSWIYRLANTTWYPFFGGAGRASYLVSGTAVASTSGTSIDFTSIPSWVKRITVMLAGVSLNGTSSLRIQIGAGSVETSGYVGSTSIIGGSSAASSVTASAGFDLNASSPLASALTTGSVVLLYFGSNQWIASGWVGYDASTQSESISGRKTTSGTLDRVRITTVNGTDTFDAGSVNILYE